MVVFGTGWVKKKIRTGLTSKFGNFMTGTATTKAIKFGNLNPSKLLFDEDG